MKTTKKISMLQFLNEVGVIAKQAGKVVHCVTSELSQYTHGGVGYEFRCYVEGYNWYTGKTPNEAICKLKHDCFPESKSRISDCVFELPETESDMAESFGLTVNTFL